MKDRYSTITLSGRTFAIVIDGDDKHWWELADPSEQPAFDEAWEQMRVRLGYAPSEKEAA
jgi:hypothetical protein